YADEATWTASPTALVWELKSAKATVTVVLALTVHWNVVLAPMSPLRVSLAVMITGYGPNLLAPGSTMPEMTPVAGLMLKPGGRPVALNFIGFEAESVADKL